MPLVWIFNTINIDSYNSHKQIYLGSSNFLNMWKYLQTKKLV